MKLTKSIGIGTLLWLLIFTIDTIYELFQINETSEVITLTGLRITTDITQAALHTQFALTWQTLMMYLAFLFIFVLFMYVMNRKKVETND